ncbi:hypothetical protein TUM22923_14340 [Polynucleobacter sp. TUM22923]|jgi:uncharacterized protein (DUF934 family)|uniref:DUF934 domain-containing protein n=1 Tax=Polynucleobacter sp. TUM22923 TaxID=3022126 RepID=UPI0025736117|nr:DUF934 domain-containing protein [Polynucleobacter sp. TUM22923]BDX22113.1 hypothetical protein TUM22923_14340 [Polynucleobacter sp. TUM22923]
MNKQIISFPKGKAPSLIPNEWHVWDGGQSSDGTVAVLPKMADLENGLLKVLVPFHWWLEHDLGNHQSADVSERVAKGEVGVWFAADDDILNQIEVIEAGRSIWPVVGAHFPIFRDGRSFSTAALLRARFHWQSEIRAVGDVLVDQLLQGSRAGFDAFELREDQNLNLALKQFSLFSVVTQNSWRDQRATVTNDSSAFI